MLALSVAAGCDMNAGSAAPSPVHSYQVIEGFSRPTACAFSLGGQYLYVASVEAQGGISRFGVDRSGKAELIERDFITGVKPTDLAILPRLTDKLPAGTILGVVGNELVAWSADGNSLGRTDGIAGELAMGAVQCDADGSVYLTLTDEAILVRIEHATLDAVLSGHDEGISSTILPTAAKAIAVHEGRVCITVDDKTPASSTTGAYSVPTGDLAGATLTPVIRGLGTINGLAFTPAGTMIMARPETGDLFVLDADGRTGRNLPLGFPLQNPQQLALHVLPDGSSLLAIPQQCKPEGNIEKQSPVILLHLPEGF
jgi:hypothetical protein